MKTYSLLRLPKTQFQRQLRSARAKRAYRSDVANLLSFRPETIKSIPFFSLNIFLFFLHPLHRFANIVKQSYLIYEGLSGDWRNSNK